MIEKNEKKLRKKYETFMEELKILYIKYIMNFIIHNVILETGLIYRCINVD